VGPELDSTIQRLDVRRGWGDVLFVDIHTKAAEDFHHHVHEIAEAVRRATGESRCLVQVAAVAG
jgi:hypothetical protein